MLCRQSSAVSARSAETCRNVSDPKAAIVAAIYSCAPVADFLKDVSGFSIAETVPEIDSTLFYVGQTNLVGIGKRSGVGVA